MQDLDGFFDEPIEEQSLPNFKVWALHPFFVYETSIAVPYVEGFVKKDMDTVSITLWGWLDYPETLKEYGYIVLCAFHPTTGRIYHQEVAPLPFSYWDTLRTLFYIYLEQPNTNYISEMQWNFVRAVRETLFAHPTQLLDEWANTLRVMQRVGSRGLPTDPEEALLLRLKGKGKLRRTRKTQR
jgi:hypothetical protein